VKVHIDQEYCTGDGLCEELCPEMFAMADDGLAHVKDGGTLLEGGAPGAAVPEGLEDSVLEAQSQCAGECIYVER
jgi:ferredoxin